MIKRHNTQKGFTLLFAVLVATLVVSIGATIISIALRQTILSGTSRESQYAFYAANTALECARYWDSHGPIDGDGNDIVFPFSGFTESRTAETDITCAGINITNGDGADIARSWLKNGDETTFYLEIKNQANSPKYPAENYKYCAEATVKKEQGSPSTVITTIEAKGYNTCDEASPRRVERGLVLRYES